MGTSSLGTIYAIVNTTNLKRYVGKTTRPVYIRWSKHLSQLSNNCHVNPHLQNAWNCYGEEAFDFHVLEAGIPEDELSSRELFWMHKYKTLDPSSGYNILEPDSTPMSSTKRQLAIIESSNGFEHESISIVDLIQNLENAITRVEKATGGKVHGIVMMGHTLLWQKDPIVVKVKNVQRHPEQRTRNRRSSERNHSSDSRNRE